ncbi:MAG: hypothetical protein JSV25_02100 [Spirochaetota bacterium]|nr:MAG: hypothetical protein JSV25_02100 [Spirochaetota bacterium]
MKKRMQITVSEDLKKQMDDAKDFYGGYSGLIEKAVSEFLTRPVEPYEDDIKDFEEAKQSDEWIDIESLRKKIRNQ